MGNSVQTDNRQGTFDLVQMGATEPDLGEIAIAIGSTGRKRLQRLVGTLECEVDLALDPGQRADIEFRCEMCIRDSNWRLSVRNASALFGSVRKARS